MSFRSLSLCLLAALPLTACAPGGPDSELSDEEIVGEAADELGIGPTVLTLYQHANLTGTTYVASLPGVGEDEALRLISKPDIEAAGLAGKISAAKLKCGARGARVVLFAAYNQSNTSFSQWSHGVGKKIECAPGQTVVVDLHQTVPALGDGVASAMLVTHARDAEDIPFTDYFEAAWGAAMDQLPSEATPTQTRMWLSTPRTFHVRQHLTIDHYACSERGAVFEYRVRLDEDGFFDANKIDSYVDYGAGDSLGCRNTMKSILDQSLVSAASELEGGLDDLLEFWAPDARRTYFVPDASLKAFDLMFSPEPEVIENAPL